jgi:hypothetical protein
MTINHRVKYLEFSPISALKTIYVNLIGFAIFNPFSEFFGMMQILVYEPLTPNNNNPVKP